jgi:hypothetical protein
VRRRWLIALATISVCVVALLVIVFSTGQVGCLGCGAPPLRVSFSSCATSGDNLICTVSIINSKQVSVTATNCSIAFGATGFGIGISSTPGTMGGNTTFPYLAHETLTCTVTAAAPADGSALTIGVHTTDGETYGTEGNWP